MYQNAENSAIPYVLGSLAAILPSVELLVVVFLPFDTLLGDDVSIIQLGRTLFFSFHELLSASLANTIGGSGLLWFVFGSKSKK